MAIRNDVPQELREVVDHARRLAMLLIRAEDENQKSIWLCGRGSEILAVVKCTLKDFRSGVFTTEKACESLSEYLEVLHKGAELRLGGGPLECCSGDETNVLGVSATVTTARRRGGIASVDETLKKAWRDGKDVVSLIGKEIGTVERCAKSLAERMPRGHTARNAEFPGRLGREFGLIVR